MRAAFLLVLVLLALFSSAQDSETYPEREKGLWGVGAQALGPVSIGLYSDAYLSSRIQSTFGVSFNLSLALGINYHFIEKPRGLSPYIGLQLVSIRQSASTISLEGTSRTYGAYVPLGLQYIMPSGLSFGVDVGPSFLDERYDQLNTNTIIGSVRVVYHFIP